MANVKTILSLDISQVKSAAAEAGATLKSMASATAEELKKIEPEPVKQVKEEAVAAAKALDNTEKSTEKAAAKVKTVDASKPAQTFQQAGEKISKAGGAISAVAGQATAAGGKIGALGQVIGALASGPMAILAAAFGIIMAVGMKVWDTLVESTEEYAAKLEKTIAETQKAREEELAVASAMQQHLERLSALNSAEHSNISGLREQKVHLAALEAKYGDLGAVIDETTGKIINFAAVRARAEQRQRGTDLSLYDEEIRDQKKLALARLSGIDGKADAIRVSSLPTSWALGEIKDRRNSTNVGSEIDEYDKVVKLYEHLLQLEKERASVSKTGYKTEEEAYQAAAARKGRIDSTLSDIKNISKERARRNADSAYSATNDIDERKTNREALIAEEQKKFDALRANMGAMRDSLAKGETGGDEANLEYYKIQKEMWDSRIKIEELKKQITDDAQRANKVIQASLDAKKEETQAANERLAGREKEYRIAKAIADLEKSAGRKLTGAERAELEASVTDEFDRAKKRESLNEELSNARASKVDRPVFEGIRTNSLTSRGGFASGVLMQDKEAVQKKILDYSQQQFDVTKRIEKAVNELKTV